VQIEKLGKFSTRLIDCKSNALPLHYCSIWCRLPLPYARPAVTFPTKERRHPLSRWESNPRPIDHKSNILPYCYATASPRFIIVIWSVPIQFLMEFFSWPWPVVLWQLLHAVCQDLAAVDHSKIYYRPFRKDFYVEVPEIRNMTPEGLPHSLMVCRYIAAKWCSIPTKLYHADAYYKTFAACTG